MRKAAWTKILRSDRPLTKEERMNYHLNRSPEMQREYDIVSMASAMWFEDHRKDRTGGASMEDYIDIVRACWG